MLAQIEGAATDAIVVGGGLSGLTAAAYLARAGRSVTVYERSRELGGRARTVERDGFALNMGPHALYRRAGGAPILRELGVQWRGGQPAQSGYGVMGGALVPLPTGLRSFLTTPLLRGGGKREFLALVPRLLRADTEALRAVSLQDWLDRSVRHDTLRVIVAMLVRTATYTVDYARLSAGEALAQTKLALAGNVDYIDGGWRVLIEGVRDAAEAAGARIVADTPVIGIERGVGDGAVRGVRLADGSLRQAGAVIIATDPATAADLVGDPATPLRGWAERAIPAQMACFDVGLSALPDPRGLLAFGIDQPLYLSVHSAVARLAPEGGAVIHLGKYLRGDQPSDPEEDRRDLETLLDQVQPGWRERVVARLFLPRMTVVNALVTAEDGGLQGRPGPAVPGVPGLFVAGDWVGPTGMLVDAALSSAKRAAQEALAIAPQPLLAAA